MTDYMGKIHALFHEFNELLALSPDPATETATIKLLHAKGITQFFFMIRFWVL